MYLLDTNVFLEIYPLEFSYSKGINTKPMSTS